MAVDVSGSMRALDLSEKNHELTRLDAVKRVFEQFVLGSKDLDGRPDDAIGLVAFARYADTRSPLTLDHGNLVTAARQLDFAREDEDGTAIGAGLELAVAAARRVQGAQQDRRSLLTDGESNVHDIDEDTAIEDAKKAGVKVYTIGAGTNGVAPIARRPRRRPQAADADARSRSTRRRCEDRRQDRRPVLPRDRHGEPAPHLQADRQARAHDDRRGAVPRVPPVLRLLRRRRDAARRRARSLLRGTVLRRLP